MSNLPFLILPLLALGLLACMHSNERSIPTEPRLFLSGGMMWAEPGTGIAIRVPDVTFSRWNTPTPSTKTYNKNGVGLSASRPNLKF